MNTDNTITPEVYNALVAHYLHQDNLIWTSIQYISLVQVGTLTAGFALRSHWLGAIIMAVGGILSILIALFIMKCSDDRDINLELIDYLGDKLVPKEFKQKIEAEIIGLKRIQKANRLTKIKRKRLYDLSKYESRFIWFACPFLPTWRNWARANYLLKLH
jgi:hypothetical protein